MLIALLLSGGAAAPAGSADSPAAEQVLARARELLAAYARDDEASVVGMLDPKEITVYGSDLAEIRRSAAGLRRMMADDFALWHSAQFGAPVDVDVRVGGRLATAYFHVSFTVAGRPPVIVRFATTWRREGGRWWLTQCASTVPTTGASAGDLLRSQQE
jgi:hypothetical protein